MKTNQSSSKTARPQSRRDFLRQTTQAGLLSGLVASPHLLQGAAMANSHIDAHVHVWTPDLKSYPLAKGYKKENIVVERIENVLSIHGEKSLRDVADESYLHRGITRKAFKRSFTISEDVRIDKATFVDGILTVDLHVEIPEERRPRQIDIE